MGSSQNSTRSLETRVRGLEISVNEISKNLASLAVKVTNSDRACSMCCRLPGSDFLRFKFWRRMNEGGYSNSRITSKLVAPTSYVGEKLDKVRFRTQGGFMVNPLAEEVHSQYPRNLESINRLNYKEARRQARENTGRQ